MLGLLIELIKLYLLQKLMGYSTTKKLITPGCAIIVSLAVIWFSQDNLDENTFEILCGFLEIISIALLVKGGNRYISVFLGVFILWFVDIFFQNIFIMLFSEAIEPFVDSFSLVILATLTVALKCLKKPPLIKFESYGKRQILIFMAGLLSFALYLAPYQIAGYENDSLQMNKFLAIISAVSGIFFIVISINAGQKHHYMEIASITESMRRNQENYFMLLLNKEEETKRFRHDFNNHLYSIKYLLENGKTGDLKKYVDGMDIASVNLRSEIQTGSDIINAIICELKERYKNVNYTIDWNGFFPSTVKIDPIDLSSIFYNLLTNAIEAVCKLTGEEDRKIRVVIKQSNNLLYFSVKNHCVGKAIYTGNGFATSKKSRGLHGFGSQNVAMNVEKYGGEIKYSTNENEFEAEVFFFDLQ
ncbi:MAG: GHKL domain-containing protein [Oscillospiraceae bacterium]|nr:GHKL domain-containing protein [Oscillospiraceae bacterium]